MPRQPAREQARACAPTRTNPFIPPLRRCRGCGCRRRGAAGGGRQVPRRGRVRLPLGPDPRGASLTAAGGRRGRKLAQDDGGPDRKPAQNGGGIGTAQDGPRSRVRGSSSFLRRRFIRSQKNTNPQLFLKPKIPRWGPGKRCETIKKPRAIKTKTGAGSEAGRKRAWGPQGAPGPLAGLPPLFCSSRDFCFCARVFFPLSHSVFRGPGGKFLASKTIVRSCFCGSGRGAWKRCVFPDLVDFGRF